MTTRNSFRKRPPFPFVNRTRSNHLVCDPRSYVRAWAGDGRPLYADEARWAPGPAELGTIPANATFDDIAGTDWFSVVCADTGVILMHKRGAGNTMTTHTPPLGTPTIPQAGRHHDIAFDQSGNPMWTWEADGRIYVTQVDESTNLLTTRGPFTGVDPVLLFDYTNRFVLGDSDIVLFYLSADRERIYYRLQRDQYATATLLLDYGAPIVLDAARALVLRYELLIADEQGTRLDSIPVSDLYPLEASHTTVVTPTPSAGAHAKQAESILPSDAASVTPEPAIGAYLEMLRLTTDADATSITPAPKTGGYLETTRITEDADAASVTPTPSDAAYVRSIAQIATETGRVSVTPTPATGVYREA